MRDRLWKSDKGSSIFMLAISLFLLIGASAVAVDIAAVWLDRSTDQKVTDAAAAAGAIEAFYGGGRSACVTALSYLAVNTSDLDSSDLDLSRCTTDFSATCNPGEALIDLSAGRYSIDVVYPVPDGDDLMTTRTVGRHPQALHPEDGDQCERLGVKMTSTRNSLFAQVLGFAESTTTVHTVARHFEDTERPPFNLLVLDRTGCASIRVNGGGQIIAEPVFDPDTGQLAPSLIAADTNGAGCNNVQGIINVDGGGSTIRADGPAGCDNGVSPYTYQGLPAEQGCGRIQVFTETTGICEPKACVFGGGGNAPNPVPTTLGRRHTRETADHKFNCFPDYTNPPGTTWAADALTGNQSIDGCLEGGAPHIYNLINFVGENGEPAGFVRWTDLPGASCNQGSDIVVNENVVVNCSNFGVGANVTINGAVVFNRNVQMTSDAQLTVNPPAERPWVFFRGGRLKKTGSAQLAFNNAMVFMSKGSEVDFTGGSGTLTWTAPVDGDFDTLALWSEATGAQTWSGQADLVLKGIFFMPRGEVKYSGSSAQAQTEAQWIAWTLDVGGGAVLRLSPGDGNFLQPRAAATSLVR